MERDIPWRVGPPTTSRREIPTFKVALIGNSGVGKSSLFLRVRDNKFPATATNTIGIDHCSLTLQVDGVQVQLTLWDTGGVERFRTLTQNFYRNVRAVLLCCSVDAPSSLYDLSRWDGDVREYAPKAIKFLLSTKNDLDIRPNRAALEAFANKYDCNCVFSTSAMTGQGISDVISTVAQQLLRTYSLEKFDKENSWLASSVHVTNGEHVTKKKSSCC